MPLLMLLARLVPMLGGMGGRMGLQRLLSALPGMLSKVPQASKLAGAAGKLGGAAESVTGALGAGGLKGAAAHAGLGTVGFTGGELLAEQFLPEQLRPDIGLAERLVGGLGFEVGGGLGRLGAGALGGTGRLAQFAADQLGGIGGAVAATAPFVRDPNEAATIVNNRPGAQDYVPQPAVNDDFTELAELMARLQDIDPALPDLPETDELRDAMFGIQARQAGFGGGF